MKILKARHPAIQVLPAMALLAFAGSCAATEANEQAPEPNESAAVSTDGFGQIDSENNAAKGDGTGDLVLVIYDPSGKSPRKKSFLLDLSATNKDGTINDLNLNDVIEIHQSKRRKPITIENDELSKFIESSKSQDQLVWQVFAIANHYETGDKIGDTTLINYGFATTELTKPKAPLGHQEIHQSKIHRANLILENNNYDISANGSLISFTGEPSAFSMNLHSMLANGTPSIANIDQKLVFGMHKLHLKNDKAQNKFSTSYEDLGSFKLKQSKTDKTWQLIYSHK